MVALPTPPHLVDRYRIAMRDTDVMWMEGIVQRVCQKLFAACHTLEAAYKYFDVDGSGVIGKTPPPPVRAPPL